jgi:cob(I)alamin adenosyltransferase
MKIYTRKGDDGTTGLLYGGRVPKNSEVIEANGAVDEAQAALGVVRAQVERGSELDTLLVGLERDLYVLMAELATAPTNRPKLTPAVSLVTDTMVGQLEQRIDDLSDRFPPIKDFVIPGHDPVSAALDVARTAVRRAERCSLGAAPEGSLVVQYLNRLSDLLWTMARWQEHGESLLSRRAVPGAGVSPTGRPEAAGAVAVAEEDAP